MVRCRAMTTASAETELRARIRAMIVERLKLDVEADSIGDGEPLFGEGLDLDSIDALELVLALEQEFGVRVEDEEVAFKAMSSVDGLAEFLIAESSGAVLEPS